MLYVKQNLQMPETTGIQRIVTHKAVRPGAWPHVPPVMAEGDFQLMTPLYDHLQ